MEEVSTGRLTRPLSFVFTDVVGSTKLWAADPEATARSFVIHDRIVREVLGAHGTIFGWAGDSFRASFDNRADAVKACDEVHGRLAEAPWGTDPALRVRIGVTHGPALHRDGDFFGPLLNTAARLCEIGRPGQTVLAESVVDGLEGVTTTPLGQQRVRDVAEAIELFQLGAESFGPLRTIDAALSTIPPSPGRLVGRSGSLGEVRAALEDRVPVTLVGTGGAGKTRLAIEVAHLELSEHADGAYFVDLASITDEAGVAPAIARSSRIKLAGGEPFAEIVEYFAARRALVVLDNCEHLIPTVQRFVRSLRVGAPAMSVLATSREALGVPAERVVALGPLGTSADGGPAVELFVERIRDSSPGYDPTLGELRQIGQICEHLDGIPLAIELAASRAGVLGLEHVLSGMHDRFRVLSSRQGDRARTLREAIDWSFGLLTTDEQTFFARCGVFNGAFSLGAASAVMPDVDALDVADLLHSLSRKSLIVSEGALGGRFRLLETLREYALLRLRADGIEADVRLLHFEHYCAQASADDFDAARDLGRAAVLASDWSNIAGALEWGTTTGRWEQSAALAGGCVGLWEDHVDAIEGKRWADLILPHLPGDELASAILKTGLAGFEAQLDNFERIHTILGELVESPFAEIQCNALTLVGYLQARTDPQGSSASFDQAETVMRAKAVCGDAPITMAWTKGSVSLYDADYEAAYRIFREGFDAARSTERRTVNSIYVGLSLATVEVLLARPSDAIVTLDSYNWADSRWDSSPIIRAVALIDLDRAAEAVEIVFAFAHECLLGRLHRMSNDALLGFAALALRRGERDRAWTLLRQAVTPRTPFTIGLAEGLADRLGRGDELRSIHRTRQVALSELDAIDELRAELDRLSDELSTQLAG